MSRRAEKIGALWLRFHTSPREWIGKGRRRGRARAWALIEQRCQTGRQRFSDAAAAGSGLGACDVFRWRCRRSSQNSEGSVREREGVRGVRGRGRGRVRVRCCVLVVVAWREQRLFDCAQTHSETRLGRARGACLPCTCPQDGLLSSALYCWFPHAAYQAAHSSVKRTLPHAVATLCGPFSVRLGRHDTHTSAVFICSAL